MPKKEVGGTQKKELSKDMEISKEEAIKENKKLAKTRNKTIAEKDDETLKKIKVSMTDPNFLINTIKEIQKEVNGEIDTIIALIIIANTRLVKNAIPESRNFFLSDKTGLGKDWITKNTMKVIIPEENYFHLTKMSNEGFTYWHANEKDWTWDDKVIHFEDITQSLLNSSTFKTMASGGSHAAVVKDQKTILIPVKGKPVMIPTSHHANPKDEALRRFPIGALDETAKQTREIKGKIAKKYSGGSKCEINYIQRSAVQSLESYNVIIPYAEMIQFFFPDDTLMRTHFHRFLDYIGSSAVFHQKQREEISEKTILATPDDYMIARLVLIYTSSNPKMIPSSSEYRDILQILLDNVQPMSVSEIFFKCDKSKKWLYKHLPNLVETKLVIKTSRDDVNANKKIDVYQYAPDKNFRAIPTWDEIQRKIEKIIENTGKTEKTTNNNSLERWFFLNGIKPKKPKGGGFYLVFSDWKIPFNRRVLSVFSVLTNYLRESDENRYRKYYEKGYSEKNKKEDQQKILDTVQNEETDLIDRSENEKKEPSQHEKILEVKDYCLKVQEKGLNPSHPALVDHFDENTISKLIESGQLNKIPKTDCYRWGDS